MRHRLQDATLAEARFVGQLHRVEDGPGGDADSAQLRHRFVLCTLPCPTGDDLVDLGLALRASIGCVVTRVSDQVLSPDEFQQTWPVLGVRPAG